MQVYVRWLTDSDKYNEWMNEGDYETEEAVAEAEAAGAKRKAEGGAAAEEEAPEAAPAKKVRRGWPAGAWRWLEWAGICAGEPGAAAGRRGGVTGPRSRVLALQA
jgi:hypothetical protein